MPEPEAERVLADDLRTAWHRYVDLLAPLRPALFAYCRRLTGNVWDAEDLAQDTLLRVFGQWGVAEPQIRDLRSYLLRTATNVWIDLRRRRETEARAPLADPAAMPSAAPAPDASSDVRDAGARLLQRLAPRERAALVLKEAFDMTLEEIATLLATTTGAVKSALHRGRASLREPEEAADASACRRGAPSPELLDRFIDHYSRRDVNGLVALMLEGASAENVGNSFHVGLDPVAGVPRFLEKVVHGHPEWPAEFLYESARLVRVEVEGEPVLLALVTRRGREKLEVALRFDEEDGRIARIRAYGFCPETMRAIGELTGLPVRTGIYRAPTPAPGARWPE
ncbi:MAG TPA: sigma-70 family RNA polymerase sigma factor [Candidatus Binatia bacterium]|nr:sigma-70 family RNA polymerase sigma factor [Candidatus Binatia bacterium]